MPRVEHLVHHFFSALVLKARRKCDVCKDFSAPEAQASLQNIISRAENGCLGCRLLGDIFNHFGVGDTQNAWISMVAPTSYTSLYRLQSNVFGSLEIFVTQGNIIHIRCVRH
jgi:hypothetical protein